MLYSDTFANQEPRLLQIVKALLIQIQARAQKLQINIQNEIIMTKNFREDSTFAVFDTVSAMPLNRDESCARCQ